MGFYPCCCDEELGSDCIFCIKGTSPPAQVSVTFVEVGCNADNCGPFDICEDETVPLNCKSFLDHTFILTNPFNPPGDQSCRWFYDLSNSSSIDDPYCEILGSRNIFGFEFEINSGNTPGDDNTAIYVSFVFRIITVGTIGWVWFKRTECFYNPNAGQNADQIEHCVHCKFPLGATNGEIRFGPEDVDLRKDITNQENPNCAWGNTIVTVDVSPGQ